MQRLLVTGAGGYIGSALAREAITRQYSVRALVRRPGALAVGDDVRVCDLFHHLNLLEHCEDIDCVVHLAGRAHAVDVQGTSIDRKMHAMSLDATQRLAEAAVAAGVGRFVFVSSIGVHGSRAEKVPFDESSPENPHSAYSESKLAAERFLRKRLYSTATELVVVRPPLVYSAHAPGNFARLIRLVASGLPLPLAGVRNRRSLVALENLVDFLVTCAVHPRAAGQSFVIADGDDQSTEGIVRALAHGMSKPARLFGVSPVIAKRLLGVLGRNSVFESLWHSLIVDASKAREILGWLPVRRAEDALVTAGSEYAEMSRKRTRDGV